MGWVDEKFLSRSSHLGNRQGQERVFTINAADENEAIALLKAALPDSYPVASGTFRLIDYGVDPIGPSFWIGQGSYEQKRPDDNPSFSFELGGGTAKILVSKEVIASYGTSPPTCDGSIGATADGVEGCEIFVPSYSWSEIWRFNPADADATYRNKVKALLAAPVNNATFRGYPAGEVLFMGATGSQTGQNETEVTFKFSQSPNVTSLTVGGLTGIAKKGWEFLDQRFTEAVVNNILVKTLQFIYIHRVYDSGDFTTLNIGTAP